MMIASEKMDAKLAVLSVAAVIVFLYLFGIQGLMRSASMGFDFEVFHRAASVFLQGHSPWLALANDGSPFAYPPHTLSLLTFYGLLPYTTALALHTAINILSIAVMAFLANRWFLHIVSLNNMSIAQGLGLAVIIGNPFMAHSVFEGQLTLPAAAALMLSWHFLGTRRPLWAGIFLALASIKPQLSFFYLLWLLVTFQLRVVLTGGILIGLLLLPVLVVIGPVDTFAHWLVAVASYAAEPVNQPGSPHVVGLESLWVASGLGSFGWLGAMLGVIGFGWLVLYRSLMSRELTVQLFVMLALTFIYGHDTAYAAIMILWSLMLYLALASNSHRRVLIAIGLTLAFFFPQRFLREIDYPLLHHTRTLLLPLAGYLAYRWQPKIKSTSHRLS